MSETRICPQCEGAKRIHRFQMDIPCEICTGTGRVPEWDYERLCKLVGKPADCEQVEMPLLEGSAKWDEPGNPVDDVRTVFGEKGVRFLKVLTKGAEK